MKIIGVIDNLGAGGAQRQMVALMVLLKGAGHEVSLITYHPQTFFLPALQGAGIAAHSLQARSRWLRPVVLKKMLKMLKPHAVLAFLEGPSLYCELAGLPSRDWGLVVSERIQLESSGVLPDWKRRFHSLADYITTNSHANRRALMARLPNLADRIATIYNSLDLQSFLPGPAPVTPPSGGLRFVSLGSYQPRKNLLGLVRALGIVKQKRPTLRFRLDWYGALPPRSGGDLDPAYCERVQQEARRLGLQDHWGLHGPEKNVVALYRGADAVVHPSLVEGLPNVLCETLATGRPALAGRIGDAEILVEENRNGLLFDPKHPQDIARAILQFCDLPGSAKVRMGIESRRTAERLFEPGAALRAYGALLEASVERRAVALPHWPPEPMHRVFGPVAAESVS